MKKYNALLMAFLVGFSVNLIASENTKQSFIESTQERLEDTAMCYAAGYGLLHYFAIGLSPLRALERTHSEIRWAKILNDEKFSSGKKVSIYGKELKEVVFGWNKGIIRTHRIAAPFVFGSSLGLHTYNTLQKNMTDKE